MTSETAFSLPSGRRLRSRYFLQISGATRTYIGGDTWYLICLDGNICFENGWALYNANFMLGDEIGQFVGDFCGYRSLQTEERTTADANGWVWAAWQVVHNTDGTMTLRQWLKFGPDGEVFPAGYWDDTETPGEEIVVAGQTSIEGYDVPATFMSGPPRFIRVGDDNTFSGNGAPSNSWLCRARVYRMTEPPTQVWLEQVASLSDPDYSAWGDWELCWNDGPVLTDRSGHGHDLTVEAGGTLYPGAVFP
jgi:hypothetical protein